MKTNTRSDCKIFRHCIFVSGLTQDATTIYDQVYCQRGEAENRIAVKYLAERVRGSAKKYSDY